MYRRLRLRLTLVCLCAMGLILSLLTAGALRLSETQLRQRAREQFEGSASAVVNVLAGGGPVDYAWLSRSEADSGLLLDVESGGEGGFYARLRGREALFALARDGAAAAGFDAAAPAASLSPETAGFEVRGADGARYYAQAAKIPLPGGGRVTLYALGSQSGDRAQIARLRLLFGLLVLLALAGLGAFSYWFTARTLRPIEENQRRQTQFIHAASHELRAPLAVLRASLETVRRSPADTAQLLGGMEEECGRMARLVDDLLELARADDGTWSLRPEETGVETLVLTAAEQFEPRAAGKGQSLRVSLPEEVLLPCRCDPQRVAQVLAVLLSNAVSYTPENGRIEIGAAKKRGGVEIRVEDSGPGIPPQARERVFERFYRADPARGGNHSGLGLAIAREIVALHGGSIRADESALGGAAFCVWLPRG